MDSLRRAQEHQELPSDLNLEQVEGPGRWEERGGGGGREQEMAERGEEDGGDEERS